MGALSKVGSVLFLRAGSKSRLPGTSCRAAPGAFRGVASGALREAATGGLRWVGFGSAPLILRQGPHQCVIRQSYRYANNTSLTF